MEVMDEKIKFLSGEVSKLVFLFLIATKVP